MVTSMAVFSWLIDISFDRTYANDVSSVPMPSRLGLYAMLYAESRDRQHDADAERTETWNSGQAQDATGNGLPGHAGADSGGIGRTAPQNA